MQTLIETRKGVVIVNGGVSVCPKQEPVANNEKAQCETEPDGKEKNGFCGATTLTGVGNGSVLLQTTRAYAVNSSTLIPVRIVVDTGSQRSYVTNDVTRRLKLTVIKR